MLAILGSEDILSFEAENLIRLDVTSFKLVVSKINFRQMAASPVVSVTMNSFFKNIHDFSQRGNDGSCIVLTAQIKRMQAGIFFPRVVSLDVLEEHKDSWKELLNRLKYELMYQKTNLENHSTGEEIGCELILELRH